MPTPLTALMTLSRALGREDCELAILGEGNVSVRRSPTSFYVKASGCRLATLTRKEVTSCRFDRLVPLLEAKDPGDRAVDAALQASREAASAKKPSVEAIFHAWLLTLPGVNFVGHTHPVAVNRLLCSRWGKTFAERRLFPDEVVCCGEASVFIPYVDPGLKLAQAIRHRTGQYLRRRGSVPRLILLENHGLIALGATADAVLAATLMAAKAAEIFAGASALNGGGAPRFLSAGQVARIAGRPDEHYRRRMLGLQ